MSEVGLGILADLLDALPGDAVVSNGFDHPHSWRGIYAEVAFQRATNVRVSAMRADVERALTEVFEGWKGGDYSYDRYTPAHLSIEGSSVEFDWSSLVVALRAAAHSGRPPMMMPGRFPKQVGVDTTDLAEAMDVDEQADNGSRPESGQS